MKIALKAWFYAGISFVLIFEHPELLV